MSLRTSIVAVGAALSLAVGGTALAQGGSPNQAQPPSCPCPGHKAQGMGAGAGAGMGAAGASPGSTPMMPGGGCGAMAQMHLSRMANVTVQDTPQGAIVRFDAKDPSQVAAIQGMAQQMSSCMAARAQGCPNCPDSMPSR